MLQPQSNRKKKKKDKSFLGSTAGLPPAAISAGPNEGGSQGGAGGTQQPKHHWGCPGGTQAAVTWGGIAGWSQPHSRSPPSPMHPILRCGAVPGSAQQLWAVSSRVIRSGCCTLLVFPPVKWRWGEVPALQELVVTHTLPWGMLHTSSIHPCGFPLPPAHCCHGVTLLRAFQKSFPRVLSPDCVSLLAAGS